MKYLLCLFALATFVSNAQAAPSGTTLQTLFTMSNDRDANQDTFSLLIDDKGQAAGFNMKPNGHEGREDSHWMKDVEKPDGVTLVEGQGHRVVILQGQLGRGSQEGRFHMKYLANGLSNTYATCDFLLKKSRAGWFVQNAYNGSKVTGVKIITHALGLKTLQGICK